MNKSYRIQTLTESLSGSGRAKEFLKACKYWHGMLKKEGIDDSYGISYLSYSSADKDDLGIEIPKIGDHFYSIRFDPDDDFTAHLWVDEEYDQVLSSKAFKDLVKTLKDAKATSLNEGVDTKSFLKRFDKQRDKFKQTVKRRLPKAVLKEVASLVVYDEMKKTLEEWEKKVTPEFEALVQEFKDEGYDINWYGAYSYSASDVVSGGYQHGMDCRISFIGKELLSDKKANKSIADRANKLFTKVKKDFGMIGSLNSGIRSNGDNSLYEGFLVKKYNKNQIEKEALERLEGVNFDFIDDI